MAYGIWPTRTNLIALDNNVMHTNPDLCVNLKWMIAGSGSVIADIIRLGIRWLLTLSNWTPR